MDEPSDPLSRCSPTGPRVCMDAVQSVEVVAGPRTAAVDEMRLSRTHAKGGDRVGACRAGMDKPSDPLSRYISSGLVCVWMLCNMSEGVHTQDRCSGCVCACTRTIVGGRAGASDAGMDEPSDPLSRCTPSGLVCVWMLRV